MKDLYRDTRKAQIAGVCAGLSDVLDIDINVVRILFLASVFILGGGGALVYGLAWIMIPPKRATARIAQRRETNP